MLERLNSLQSPNSIYPLGWRRPQHFATNHCLALRLSLSITDQRWWRRRELSRHPCWGLAPQVSHNEFLIFAAEQLQTGTLG